MDLRPVASRLFALAALGTALLCALAEEVVNKEDQTAAFRTAVCTRGYTLSCLKLDLVGLVARAGGGGRYQLLPGVFFSHNLTVPIPSEELIRAVKEGGNATQDLESYVAQTVNDYLSSLTLSVKVMDPNTMSHARKISEHILSSFAPMETGRKKGYYGGALWAAGTLAAVGLAGLAALSGKALMTSMLAMTMAGATVLRNSNGNGNGNGGGGGCKSAHIIDAHARAYELERLAGVEPVEVYSQSRPVYAKPLGLNKR